VSALALHGRDQHPEPGAGLQLFRCHGMLLHEPFPGLGLEMFDRASPTSAPGRSLQPLAQSRLSRQLVGELHTGVDVQPGLVGSVLAVALQFDAARLHVFPTQIFHQPAPHLVLGRVRVVVEQGLGRHDKAGRADAALQRRVL